MKPKFRASIGAFPLLSRSSLIVCVSLCAAASVHADQTWTGLTDVLWPTTANWSGSALPSNTENAVFDATSAANLTIDTGANQAVGGISLTSPSGPVTINNNTLTIGKGGIDMSTATQDLTINSVGYASAGKQKWPLAAGRSITVTAAPGKDKSITAVVEFGTTGTIKLGTGPDDFISDSFDNPYATFGTGDFGALNATGNVVAAAYEAAPGGGTLPATLWIPKNVQGNYTGANAIFTPGLRFNSSTAVDVTVANSGTTRTLTCGAILVTPNSGASSIGANLRINAYIRTNRPSGGGGISTFNIIQNSSADFTIGAVIGNSSSTTSRLVKTGVGKLISLQNNAYSAGTYIDEGALQFGDGTAGHNGFPGGGDITNFGSVVFKRAETITLVHNIGGTGSFTQEGPGELDLTTSVSTFTGPVNITGGKLGVTSMANLGNGTAININNATFKFLGAIDPSVRDIAIGSSGATFDTNGNAITLANAFASGSTGAVTKIGAGSLTLAADNDYSGGTTVNVGTLLANAPTSSTGSGSVVVNTGASLGGTGAIAGAANITSGANLAPGTSVGTLTVGILNLNAGSTATYEFSTTPDNDKTVVTTSGGLTIDGGAITLYQEGTTIPFTTPGTYNLIGYSGSIGGAGVSALTVANPQPGFSYNFGTTGGFVTLTIATSGVVRDWVTDGGGSWADSLNWNGAFPNGSGAVANFLVNLSAPATITLDGTKTVGAMSFLSATNGYTITQGSGGSLVFDNGGSDSSILDGAGVHTILAPVTLTSNTVVDTAAASDSITLGAAVSGAGTLTKTGPGSLSLLGANDFTGLLTLNGGATTFALNGLGAGNLTISGASLIWDAATSNTQDISNRTITFGSDPVVFDTNGNDVALANSIGNGGAAALTKAGLGNLTLGAGATFAGGVTISGGVLQLGTGGTTGLVSGNIINNAELAVNLADASVFSNLVAGTGSFVHAGTGSLTLGAQNTFNGATTISGSGGSLILADALNLQNSTLNLGVAGGALSFGTLTAATLGGLSGDKNLALANTASAAVALTVGGNGESTTYSGILSGSGSLTKLGAGFLTLGGTNSYAGDTLVGAGTLELSTGGAIAGAALTVNGAGKMVISGGSFGATTGVLAPSSNGLQLDGGAATFSGALVATNTGNNANSALIKVTDGILTVPSMTLGRTGENVQNEPAAAAADRNLYITGGAVNVIGNLNVGTADGLPNSTVVTRIDGGTLAVGGALTVGLNNGGRWSILDVNGGELNSTDSVSGIVLGGAFAGKTAFLVRAGVATVERIQLGQGTLDGAGLINISGGELYVGTGGIVLGTTGAFFAPEIRLSGGTLGAKAAWSTSLPVNVSTSFQSTIKAADALDHPVAITLNGALTGTGGLIKSGTGSLTLAGGHSYAGNTSVLAGTLSVTSADFNDAATLTIDAAAGAVLNLNFTGTDQIGALEINGVPVANGTWGAPGSGAAHVSSAFTGAGILQVGAVVSGYADWGSPSGLTIGVNDGPTQDPDNDGIMNLMEYVLGGIPVGAGSADMSILPTQALDATNLVLTFHRSDLAENDTTVKVQWSNDLATWNDFVTLGAGDALPAVDVTEDVPSAALDTVVVTIPRSGREAGGKLYGRIQAVNHP